MKSLEELGTITSGSLLDVLPKIILEEVEEAARTRRFGRQLVRINEDLTRTKGRSLILPRASALKAYTVTEGSSPSTTETAISTPNTITISKIGLQAHISQEAIDASNVDIIRIQIREAGYALADKEDFDIMRAIEGAKLSSRIAVATGATLGYPITYWEDADASTNTYGVVNSFHTGVFAFCASTFCINAYTVPAAVQHYVGQGGTLTYTAILGAASLVRAQKYEPNVLVCHPTQFADILNDSSFTDASKYGGNTPLLRGEVGMISGMKVLVTTQMTEGVALVLDTRNAGWLAIKRPIDMKRWDNPQTDTVELYFFMEYGAILQQVKAQSLILDC
jgi:N4-gp56 family major capsid protein